MLSLVATTTVLGGGHRIRNAEKGEQALLETEVWVSLQPALPHPSKGPILF